MWCVDAVPRRASMLIQGQPSSCSRFGAMSMANRKGGALGLRTTGIAGCSCARHEHILPQGMATLRRGERCVFAP